MLGRIVFNLKPIRFSVCIVAMLSQKRIEIVNEEWAYLYYEGFKSGFRRVNLCIWVDGGHIPIDVSSHSNHEKSGLSRTFRNSEINHQLN